ncbi:MAG: DNA-binding protein [Lachnospiraceae bacterium]|nr:DNA-binding protein [Lachnospiraceae bacterium]
MDNIIERGRLYDYYGGLLTAHQQQIYEAVVNEDMSLSEIADDHDITRQGVFDLIKRCDKQLARYEEKLKLIERDATVSAKLDEIKSLSSDKKIGQIIEQIKDML